MQRKFVSWDVGGPLRDSSESMGYALKTAASENGSEIYLNNRLMWQLWTIKGKKFEGKGGDYQAWAKAVLALQAAAIEKGKGVNDFCMEIFSSEDPIGYMQEIVSKYDIPESVYRPIGEKAIELFGSDPVTMSKSRVNDGSIEAVELLYKNDVLMGIVSSAPTAESVIGYVENNIKKPLVEAGKIPSDAEIFDSRLIHYGKARKEEQLENSVITARDILGEEPESSWYIADTNDDIIETAKANYSLKEKGFKKEIYLAMIKNGMGIPKMWENAWKEAGLLPGKNYHEFRDSLEAAEFINNYK